MAATPLQHATDSIEASAFVTSCKSGVVPKERGDVPIPVARQLLQDYAREHRGDIKRHSPPTLGTIAQIEEGIGRIAADDGHDVYFHSNSVHGVPFNELAVGTTVEFEEEQGDKGMQAAAVRLWRSTHESRNPA